MSYNVTRCIVKKIDNLRFPISALTEHERDDLHPEISDDRIEMADECITGRTENGWFYMEDFEVYGEDSGTFMEYSLVNALKQSKGYFEVVLIWEGGHHINRIIVNEGDYTDTEIIL